MNKTYNLNLDFQIIINNPLMKFDIFDNNTSDFFIKVTNKGNLVDIEKATVVLAAIKPSGHADIQFIEIRDNSVYGNLKPSMKDETGNYTASAMLILGDKKTTLNNISYKIEQNQVFGTINNVVRSDERFTLLTDMLSRLSTIELSEQQRQDNENTRQTEFENKINELDSKISKIDTVDSLKSQAEQILKAFNDRIGDASKIVKNVVFGNTQKTIECVDNTIVLPTNFHSINVKDYIDLTVSEDNGEITWDNAFQKAFDTLADGGILTIPNGTYYIKNRAILENKEGIIINSSGIIKPISGQTSKIGTITIRNVNNATINGLTFDGNKDGITPPATFGIESLINIDNCTNIVFNNLIAFDVSSIVLNSNEGLDNIIFNNIYAKNIGEHVFYLGGNGSSNIKFNNLYCENIGISTVNENRSVSVIKLRNKAAGDRLHDNIIIDGFYFKNTVINTDNDRQLIQAFDTKNVSIKNGQIIGEDTSIFATNISIDSLICENIIFNGRRIVHGINKNSGYDNATVINNQGKFKIRFLNCELKGKNDYSTDISLYSNCIINTNNQHYTSSMATNINNEVIFDRCTISTGGTNGRLNFIFNNDEINRLEFSNVQFIGYTGTTQPLIISTKDSGKAGTINITFSDIEVEKELSNFYQGDNTINLTIRDSYINSAITNNNNKKFKYLNMSNTRIKTYSNLDTLTDILSVSNIMYIDGSRKDFKIYRQYCNYGQDNIIKSQFQRIGAIKREHLMITNDDYCKFTCTINNDNNIVINPVSPTTTSSSGSTTTAGTPTTKTSSPSGTYFTIIYQYQNAK